MSDVDPLAHLYAETGVDPVGEDRIPVPVSETTLAELEAVDEADVDEELSDEDLDELALLVAARVEAGTFDDAEAEALGLGTFAEDDDFVLNDVGRAVYRRIIRAEIPAAAEAMDRATKGNL